MRITLLILFFCISYSQAQTNLSMNVNSSYRKTEIIKNINASDTIIDNSLRYELTYTNSSDKKSLTSKEITEYCSNYKATSDTTLTSKSYKNKINIKSKIDFDDFQKLFDLFQNETHNDNYSRQKVLTTPYDLTIKLTKDNDIIKVSRKENPADYANYWYSNGKQIFNPKIDQLISQIIPKQVLGDFKLVKIPSKKSTKYHKNELNKLINKFTYYLKIKDSVNLKILAYELCPNINTVRFFEKNKLYYRGIPEVFEKKNEQEIEITLNQNKKAYASSFLNLLNEINKNNKNEIVLLKNDTIHIEYLGFLKNYEGNSHIISPRGNGAIETTHFYFKIKINEKLYELSFGEMLRVNNHWISFTSSRI